MEGEKFKCTVLCANSTQVLTSDRRCYVTCSGCSACVTCVHECFQIQMVPGNVGNVTANITGLNLNYPNNSGALQ